ncbi:hypothetical protein BASA81_016366 [Batrachochytrium salamandrivorans]|nr:hypothetical protein BASA81_016366 [Batrachochytrium salamandrivorans]
MGQPNAHITKCDDLDMSLKASLHSTLGQAQVEALFHPLSGQSDLESTFQTPNLTIPNGLPLISRRSSSASCNSRNSIPFRPISGTSIPRSNTMTTNSYTPQSFVLARGYGSRVGPVASQMPISNRAPEAEVLDDPPSLHTGLYTHTHGHKTEGSGLATNLQNDIAKQGKAGSVLARLPVNAPLLERPLGRNDISLCVSGSPCAQKINTTLQWWAITERGVKPHSLQGEPELYYLRPEEAKPKPKPGPKSELLRRHHHNQGRGIAVSQIQD